MKCVKCGREIPEGELFCAACSLKPELTRAQRAARVGLPVAGTPAKVPPAKTPKASQTVSQFETASRTAPRKKKHMLWPLITALVIVSLLAAGTIAYLIYSRGQFAVQKANLRVQEADLTLRENDLSSLQPQLDEANATISELTAERDDLKTQVAKLEDELNGNASQLTQNEFDAENQQKTISDLNDQITSLTTQISDLTEQNETQAAEISDLTEKGDALTKEYDELQTLSDGYQVKADFLDSRIVFVMNDGTNYYHSYDCPNFTKSNYWAFNKTLAISKGYTACPVCGG